MKRRAGEGGEVGGGKDEEGGEKVRGAEMWERDK